MGLNLGTVLIIQNEENDIRCEPYDHDECTGKWAGAINLYRNEALHRVLASSTTVFDSSEEAVSHMENVVENVRNTEIPLEEGVSK
jgi:hypothetical protein